MRQNSCDSSQPTGKTGAIRPPSIADVCQNTPAVTVLPFEAVLRSDSMMPELLVRPIFRFLPKSTAVGILAILIGLRQMIFSP